jgi:uncharacterized protein (TIGR04141 family)
MSKSRPFSIYLLKPGYDATNALDENHNLEPAEATELPAGASLFILDSPRTPPWWKGYFGVDGDLWQQHKGALVFLPVGDRCFALSFGQVFHHLDDHSYEYDFGLRVTLNCLDPNELKSADMVAPGPARRKRTQVPVRAELTFLDFDANSEIIKSLTGKVKPEHATLFKNATGSIALKVSLKLEPAELVATCNTLLELYNREDYKESFPNIQNIAPIKDPTKIDELDEILLTSLRDKDGNVTLTIPDIVDYRDNTCCVFSGNGQASDIFPDISLEQFYEFLGDGFDLSSLTVGAIRNYRMSLTDVEGNASQTYPLYRTLICDASPQHDTSVYHLCEGNWYKVEKSFLDRLTAYLDPKCADTDLCPYNHDGQKEGKAVYSEENYNAGVPAWDGRFISLDQTSISPTGQTGIEPCDVYTVEDDNHAQTGRRAVLYHLKISTRSSQLSHLFNQGVNAVELVQLEEVSRTKLKTLITERLAGKDGNTYLSPIDAYDFKVVFGIITHKNKDTRSKNLPLFSRISLMRIMQRLDLMRIPTLLTFIEDQSPKKGGHAKYPLVLVEICETAGGKVEVRPVDGFGYDPSKPIKGCPKQVRDGVIGARFRVSVKTAANGDLSSFHTWAFEQA